MMEITEKTTIGELAPDGMAFVGSSAELNDVDCEKWMIRLKFAKERKPDLCSAEFIASKSGVCEIVFSDHPHLTFNLFCFNQKQPFKDEEMILVVDGRMKRIMRFEYDTEKRSGLVSFEV